MDVKIRKTIIPQLEVEILNISDGFVKALDVDIEKCNYKFKLHKIVIRKWWIAMENTDY